LLWWIFLECGELGTVRGILEKSIDLKWIVGSVWG